MNNTNWTKVAKLDELPEGRVTTVVAGNRSLCLTHCDGEYGALENRCPHQGGPLGEGSIEKGWLRCPWHGYDYDPITGEPPGGFADRPESFPVEVRDDGVYVDLPALPPQPRTVSDVMVETMVEWGVTHVFGMVGHSNLGFAEAMHEREAAGDLTFIGDPPRGRGGLRRLRVRQAHGSPRRVLRDRRTGFDQPSHRPVRRQGRPRAGACHLGSGAVESARPRRVPGPRSHRGVRRRGDLLGHGAARHRITPSS